MLGGKQMVVSLLAFILGIDVFSRWSVKGVLVLMILDYLEGYCGYT